MLLQVDNHEDKWFRRADSIIKEFDDLDPDSFRFRYPVKKDGVLPSLPNDMRVDPSVVAQIMAELHILLDGASAQISHYQGLKHDWF